MRSRASARRLGTLHEKVIRVLRRKFGKVTDVLEQVRSTGRVTGVIISPAFDKLDDRERQRRISEALKGGLTEEEEANVGPIAALTPAEASLKETVGAGK